MRKGAPRTSRPGWTTRSRDTFELQRASQLLTIRIANERQSLETWERRLRLRQTWEHDRADPTQLPALRQECAACHLRLLDLERLLAQAWAEMRALRRRLGN
jgi:hypothetical protein